MPTQVEKESKNVESDKENKSSEKAKRGSKVAGSVKGKGKAPKGDLPEEENEEPNKDEAQVCVRSFRGECKTVFVRP